MTDVAIKSASLMRRLACMLYESLLLIAIAAAAVLVFVLVAGDATHAPKRYFLQAYLWFIFGGYFVWCWHKSGQTLAMQTWRIQLVHQSGQALTYGQACRRYVLATIFFGASFVWALFDREGQFLHDRLTGSRLIVTEKKKPSA